MFRTQVRNRGEDSQGWLQRTTAKDAAVGDLTFVFVCLGLDAEDGDHHDDDHDGGGRKGDHEPHLAVEGLGLKIPKLEVDLGGCLNLKCYHLNI